MELNNILSLFDGISCGQLALQRAGITYKNYYASEMNKYCIKVTQRSFPDTIQLGDVRNLRGEELSKIDLLIGGSPCQGFSFSGKQLNFNDPRSKLFFEFVRLLEECRPKYFLLENVKMKKDYQDIISKHLGVEPVEINSSLVSAQNRRRLYWCNWEVNQPKDKNILLKDILEYGVVDRDKSYCLDSNYSKGINLKGHFNYKRRQIAYTEERTKEAKQIRKEFREKYNKDYCPRRAKQLVPRKDNKMNCLTANYNIKEHIILDEQKYYRKLTPLECERLQTIPDKYTNCGISNTQRYKMIGNGWTVDVIAHIFKDLEIHEYI